MLRAVVLQGAELGGPDVFSDYQFMPPRTTEGPASLDEPPEERAYNRVVAPLARFVCGAQIDMPEVHQAAREVENGALLGALSLAAERDSVHFSLLVDRVHRVCSAVADRDAHDPKVDTLNVVMGRGDFLYKPHVPEETLAPLRQSYDDAIESLRRRGLPT